MKGAQRPSRRSKYQRGSMARHGPVSARSQHTSDGERRTHSAHLASGNRLLDSGSCLRLRLLIGSYSTSFCPVEWLLFGATSLHPIDLLFLEAMSFHGLNLLYIESYKLLFRRLTHIG